MTRERMIELIAKAKAVAEGLENILAETPTEAPPVVVPPPVVVEPEPIGVKVHVDPIVGVDASTSGGPIKPFKTVRAAYAVARLGPYAVDLQPGQLRLWAPHAAWPDTSERSGQRAVNTLSIHWRNSPTRVAVSRMEKNGFTPRPKVIYGDPF